MREILHLIDRKNFLFQEDINHHHLEISSMIQASSFLIIGGAGSIGQAVTKEIFKRNPKKLHIVDVSENNLAELIRDIRSSLGYIDGEFKTFVLNVDSLAYDAFIKNGGGYDYVLNLSALKHVRSEKDPYTLMQLCQTNIFNTNKTLRHAITHNAKKYFCVSTDKATNPVNMMGASKKIMEMFLLQKSSDIKVSTARFANVAFSDGSLLYSFNQRLQKRQPIVAPCDVKRYFITPQESGELCLMSALLGDNREIFFPKSSDELELTTFSDIAIRYIQSIGYEPYLCQDEEEARGLTSKLLSQKKYPCLFTSSDTTGEKDFEEFFTDKESLDMERYKGIGIIQNPLNTLDIDDEKLHQFDAMFAQMREQLSWSKADILRAFKLLLPDFAHQEKEKYLDAKM